ncbi:thymidylate kinase, partial [Streptococcus agalactiae]|nr:thymidylate kinase [Streptococcus agalactiae]
MIIAIQGGMAVGKTIALKIIEKVYSKIAISFVDISPVVDKINKHQLDNNK